MPTQTHCGLECNQRDAVSVDNAGLIISLVPLQELAAPEVGLADPAVLEAEEVRNQIDAMWVDYTGWIISSVLEAEEVDGRPRSGRAILQIPGSALVSFSGSLRGLAFIL